MDIQGKAALVTGTKRIGRAVAIALGREGSDVALTYRSSREEAESAVREIEAMGRRAMALKADASDHREVESAVAAAAERFGGLDILINVASIYRRKPLDQAGAADWDENMQANARGAFLFAQAAIPQMRRRGGGRIINFADWLTASRRPRYRGYASYYASKAAAVALTEALALEVAGDGILVNAIAPGPILPHEGITESENTEVLRNTPLGRWGGEESIVQAVLALLGCDFVTGETIRVDGGRHLR
jgi:NAD(P)-dependent dehydrogenase (short-subunit alcohol dehydrogenase family)